MKFRLFSSRHGLKPERVKIQKGDLDNATRTRVWNVLYVHYLAQLAEDDRGTSRRDVNRGFLVLYYHHFLKKGIDEISDYHPHELEKIREHYFSCHWYEVYDTVEFLIQMHPDESPRESFTDSCNAVLEEELCGWRVISDLVAPITSEEEMETIGQATICPVDPARDHIRNALRLLSNREEPDYTNSVKESISAVEAICKKIADDGSKTLSQTLPTLKDKLGLHGALASSLDNLYGYRNTKSGVAHGGLASANEDFDEAKMFLVICSAWVNYLVTKAAKKGVKL